MSPRHLAFPAIPRPDEHRRTLLLGGAAGTAGLLAGPWLPALAAAGGRPAPYDGAPWIGASIPQLQQQMASGALSSRDLVRGYLARIEALNPLLGAVIETNPQAVSIATQLDTERRAGRMRGPLHGIPVLVKDNIATGDTMQTTAGSLALVNARVPGDAPLVARLRAAGAIILGKANLSEWANFRGFGSVSGWSARGGFTVNPYVLDDNPWGSSSGSAVAVAADLCAAAVGTETDGSIMAPAHANSVFGLKPTLGRVSGRGIVPLAASQDAAGPMTRSAVDAALLLSAMSDPAAPFGASLQRGALQGVRLAIDAQYFDSWDWGTPYFKPVLDKALAALQSLGAVLVPVQTDPSWLINGDEFTVLLAEFKVQIAQYLATLRGSDARNLADLIRFNQTHCWQEMRYFGQELFELADQTSGDLQDPAYLAARQACILNSRTLGIDKALAQANAQALIAPTWSWLYSFAAVAGYPSVSVPIGYMPNEVVGAPWDPAEVLTRRGSPVGFCFVGGAWQEARLLRFAYDLEQALQAQRLPQYLGQLPARVEVDLCSGKPKPHGGTGNVDWRARGRRRVV